MLSAWTDAGDVGEVGDGSPGQAEAVSRAVVVRLGTRRPGRQRQGERPDRDQGQRAPCPSVVPRTVMLPRGRGRGRPSSTAADARRDVVRRPTGEVLGPMRAAHTPDAGARVRRGGAPRLVRTARAHRPDSGRAFLGLVEVPTVSVRDQRRVDLLADGLRGDHAGRDVLAEGSSYIVLSSTSSRIGTQPAGAGLAQDGEVRDRLERVGFELELDAVELEEPVVLAGERVLRTGQDVDQRLAVERLDRRRRSAGGR